LIVASITEQVAYVYRNGVCIARSSVSTGRPGHPTPTGVFTILDKAKSVITPGATLIFTDRPVDPTTQSPPNFQILVAQKDELSVQKD
jgi:lipoprotein-anchoring transpeptidase ErfK/SrfK